MTTGAEQSGVQSDVQPGARPAVRRRIRAGRLGVGTLAALTLVGGAVLGLVAPASAHNYVVSATPAANSTLTELPKTFAITTNDRLLDIGDTDSGFAFRIVGPDGRYFEDGCVDVEGPTMSTAAALGKSGEYQAEWQIISADGHTVSDSYDFTWKAPAGFTPRHRCDEASDLRDRRQRLDSRGQHDRHGVRRHGLDGLRRAVDRRRRTRRRGRGRRRAAARASPTGTRRRRRRRLIGSSRPGNDDGPAPMRCGAVVCPGAT
ncbi:copper resistance protein CopC [Curtobacterium sp. MCPF17_052]|uniref:copper resistance CopC family protein n=1 Tax=Curtobacterium sp. MCPF17_052 TaxID=2175655 RepID=UPI0024DFBA38|nr:copper resistance protein CopC [Curtobacterium sp. MCPF17_052]WIB12156.1 copper resistance protein CopC [Curtobacterium sp. MCPF17_052]